MIYLERSVIQPRASWALAWVFCMPVAAWAGRSTEGLIYLFLPFYIAFAVFLIGILVSFIYLIICVVQAKKNRYMDIERAKITKRRLFWIWTVTVLVWIMVIFFLAMPGYGNSASGLLFAAILVLIPGALVGLPLLMFAAIKARFSR